MPRRSHSESNGKPTGNQREPEGNLEENQGNLCKPIGNQEDNGWKQGRAGGEGRFFAQLGYEVRWPLIATTGELKASSVTVLAWNKNEMQACEVLLHKRRVSEAQAAGEEPALVCSECKDAFQGDVPWLCKYALANDLWLGRWDPLFRNANLSHQMLLALARCVSTKIVLRPEGRTTAGTSSSSNWDFLFHQSGMIGTAILFPNADCGPALQHFPAEKINDFFAISFVTTMEPNAQANAKEYVASKIAKFKGAFCFEAGVEGGEGREGRGWREGLNLVRSWGAEFELKLRDRV